MSRRLTQLAAVLALATPLALAGGRARLGGVLDAAAVVKTPSSDPLLADTPLEATLSLLTKSPPCRLGELSRPTPKTLRLTIKAAVRAGDVVQALVRVKDTPSPYRPLLSGVRAITAVNASVIDLELEGPAPELEQVLCHPVLAVGPSFFAPAGDRLVTNADPSMPRAWLDGITLRATDARTAERLVAQRKVQVLLGSEAAEGELLYATYLVAHPRLGPAFAAALEASIDRPGLVRFFVRPPARALTTLIPPASVGAKRAALADVGAVTPPRPAALPTPVELTLIFDDTVDGHRAVAERLQVKLGAAGYRLKLEALARRDFRERLASAPDVALVGVLMPPQPATALALALSLAKEPLPRAELDGQSDAARLDAVVERASRPTPNLFPLFVQGLGVSATKDVQHLTRDAYGLPRLDDVFLATD